MHTKFDNNDDFSGETGIFDTILCMLEHTLQHNTTTGDKSGPSLDSSSMNDSLGMGNYYMWDSKHKRIYSFDALHRDEKMHRIFVILELLVGLLENDLAMWIICYPLKKNVTMEKLHKMPLIGFVLWQTIIPGQITKKIKNILKLFVICIGIGMPQRFIDIIAVSINQLYLL